MDYHLSLYTFGVIYYPPAFMMIAGLLWSWCLLWVETWVFARGDDAFICSSRLDTPQGIWMIFSKLCIRKYPLACVISGAFSSHFHDYTDDFLTRYLGIKTISWYFMTIIDDACSAEIICCSTSRWIPGKPGTQENRRWGKEFFMEKVKNVEKYTAKTRKAKSDRVLNLASGKYCSVAF